jgi:LPS sulfotransferase NodH
VEISSKVLNEMRYRTGVKTYWRYLTSHSEPPQTKFVIFCGGRTGSTLLVSILNNHPSIQCEGELFQVPILFPQTFVNCRSALSEKHVYGFKLLTYQLLEFFNKRKPVEFLSALARMGFKIIYLRRENILRRAISNIYARQINEFHRLDTGKENDRQMITLDLDQLSTWLRWLENAEYIETDCLSHLSYLKLTYEKDLVREESHQDTLDRVVEYLDVPHAEVKASLRKITPDHLTEFIENYSELVSFVRNTPYESCL